MCANVDMPSQSITKNSIHPLPPAAERSHVLVPDPEISIPRGPKWSRCITQTVWQCEDLASSTWVGAKRSNVKSPVIVPVDAATVGNGADVNRISSEVRAISRKNTPKSSLCKTLEVSSFHTSGNNGNVVVFGNDCRSLGRGLRFSYVCGDLLEGSDSAVPTMARLDISGPNLSGSSNDTNS